MECYHSRTGEHARLGEISITEGHQGTTGPSLFASFAWLLKGESFFHFCEGRLVTRFQKSPSQMGRRSVVNTAIMTQHSNRHLG